MSLWDEPEALRAIRARMSLAAQQLRLPLRSKVWRGETGNWLGAGTGSSIDFQDHRPYLPGDDPRYIDWRAYARTGHYTMKLYREEVRPVVDLVLDVSPSMRLTERKAQRAAELFHFAAESAMEAVAALRSHLVMGRGVRRAMDLVEHGSLPADDSVPALERVPWRQGSLRVLVSDLLFPGSPEPLLAALTAGKGRGVVLAPFAEEEADPGWEGNIEFEDCERGGRRTQHVTGDLLERYRSSYARHFSLWKERGRRHGVLVARVDAGMRFHDALRAEALSVGAVEMR